MRRNHLGVGLSLVEGRLGKVHLEYGGGGCVLMKGVHMGMMNV